MCKKTGGGGGGGGDRHSFSCIISACFNLNFDSLFYLLMLKIGIVFANQNLKSHARVKLKTSKELHVYLKSSSGRL